MADYKTPQWLLPNEKNLAYPAAGDGITGSGLSEDRHSLYSMDFDGSNYIDLGTGLDIFQYNIGQSYTVSLWYKSTSSSLDRTIINLGSNPYRFYLATGNGKLAFGAGNSSTIFGNYNWLPTAGAINDGQWHHICIVQDSSGGVPNLTAYVDGSSSGSGSNTNFATQNNNRIGNGFYGGVEAGIDEVAIFNYALSATEVLALSTASAPANVMALSNKPIAYYPLGEQAQMGSANWSFPNGSLQSHAVDFDGSGDKIDLSSSIDLGTINTTSLWVRNEVSQDRTLLGEDSYGSDFYILGGYNNFILRIGSSFMVFTTGSTPIIPINSNWTHLAFVRNGDTVTCYINGSSIGSSSTWTGGSPGSTTTKFDTIGAKTAGATSWLGEMSNVAVWNSDQSTNIDNIYNNGSPQSTYTATPTAWWKLNAANSSYVYPWSLELNGNPDVSGGADFAKVVSNALQVQDINTTGTSGKVDFLTREITGAYSGIDVTGEFIVYAASSGQCGATLYYKIDGGSWVQFQQELRTDNTATTYAISGASGLTSTTSFQVKIEFETGSLGTPYVTLNNISIGDLYTEDFTNQDGAGWDLSVNSGYIPPPVDWTFIDTETPAPNYTSALSFDGTNQRIELASDSDLGINSTVSVWINSDIPIAALNDIILGYDLGYILYINNNLIYIFVDGNLQSFNHNSMVAGEWYNITVVRTGDSVEVFQNGVSLGTQTGYGTSVNTIFNQIGARSGGGFSFNGKISNVSAFNSSLSSAQVQTLYNNGTPETAISFSPTSWWKLNNTTTGIQDSGSASNNGTNNGATQIATNVLTSNNGESDTLPTSALIPSDLQFESPYSNYSLSFDGTGNYIDAGAASYLSDKNTFTISTWFNTNTVAGTDKFLVNIGSSSSELWGIQLYNSLLVVYGGSTTKNLQYSGLVSINTWYNLVLVFDGAAADTYKVYLNGVLLTPTTSVGTIETITPTFTNNLTIGKIAYSANEYWNGKIDETAVWSSALTQAQVIQVYNNGYPADLTSLSPTSWWRLGEDAYFVGNDITIPNQITGGPTGTGSGTQTAILVGDAPGSYANGSGTNLAVEDRIGDAPESTANSVSINMIPSNRISYPAGYVPTQVDNVYSMAFDGVSNSKFNVNPPTIGSDNTISAWAKRVGTGNMFLLGNTSSGGYGCYFVGTSGVYVQGSGGYFAFTNSAVTTAMVRTDWVNWVFIKNSSAGTVSVYVDGELAQSASSTGGMDSLTSIGGSGLPTGSQFPWNGNIDEVAVFNYILSERQIKQDIYNGTTTGKTADLNNISNLTAPVAWYRMGD